MARTMDFKNGEPRADPEAEDPEDRDDPEGIEAEGEEDPDERRN